MAEFSLVTLLVNCCCYLKFTIWLCQNMSKETLLVIPKFYLKTPCCSGDKEFYLLGVCFFTKDRLIFILTQFSLFSIFYFIQDILRTQNYSILQNLQFFRIISSSSVLLAESNCHQNSSRNTNRDIEQYTLNVTSR